MKKFLIIMTHRIIFLLNCGGNRLRY